MHPKAEFGARGKGDCAPESMSWFNPSRQLNAMEIVAQSPSPQWGRAEN